MARKRSIPALPAEVPADEPDLSVSSEYAEHINRELAEAEEEYRLHGGGASLKEFEGEMDAFMAQLRARLTKPTP